MKKLFTLIIAAMASAGTLFAESGTCGTNLTWELTDSVLTINGTGAMTNWTFTSYVPWDSLRSSIKSVIISNSVTNIGLGAFDGCKNLSSVTLPSSLMSIGKYAFRSCTKLTAMTIPSNVTSISGWAFDGCSNLTSVTIPNKVVSIGDCAFQSCHGLTSVTIPNSVASIGSGAFYNVNNIVYSGTATGSPWGAKCINGYVEGFLVYSDASRMVLLGCSSSATGRISLPSSVTSIGEYAFTYCSGLTSVTIPNSVTSIGKNAFQNCYNLASITIPNNVTSIEEFTFKGCRSLTSVTIPNSVISIGSNAFKDCSGLTSLTIGTSVTSIGEYAFTYCSGLTSVRIPNSVISIGEYAFRGCTGMASLTIGTSVASIGGHAFYGCTGLNSVSIPNSVTSIGGNAFQNCTGFTSITIPNSVTSIETGAFNGCTNLTSVVWNARNCNSCRFGEQVTSFVFGNEVEIIPDNICQNMTNLTLITIPNSVSSIGASTFDGCSGITSVVIGNGVTSIGEKAFYNCTGLTSVTIGNSVTSIGKSAFQYCESLTSVHISDIAAWCKISFPSSYSSPLYYAHNLYLNGELVTDLVIPEGITALGDRCLYGCTPLKSVTIPNDVTSIGANYFADCSGLKSVKIGSGMANMAKEVFMNCTALASVEISAKTPPRLGTTVFRDAHPAIYVPCEALEAYQSSWSAYASMIKCKEESQYSIIVNVNNKDAGSVKILTDGNDNIITATPNYGYHFVQWSDGNTDNSRYIHLTQDTTIMAEFAIDRSGRCGENNALTWSYDDKSQILTISGSGALTDNYTFGIEAPTQMRTLIIGNEVTAIGDSAFYGMKTINHLEIGAQVASIGDYAFAECKKFDDITCYATDVPEINATTFANVGNKEYIYLYVPDGRERAYKRDEFWSEFDIQTKGAEAVSDPGNEVVVEPSDNSADIIWPAVNDAATYEITITKDGVVVCSLIFNTNGQLVGIAFAPGRRGNAHHAQAATLTNNGFRFKITNLTSCTTYSYSVVTKSTSDAVLDTQSGTFTTTGTATTIDKVPSDQVPSTKVIENGVLYIKYNGAKYNVVGQAVSR